jgi:hypothetical protein
MKFKEAIYSLFVNMWSWICSFYIMCLSFHMAKEIIEWIANAKIEAY